MTACNPSRYGFGEAERFDAAMISRRVCSNASAGLPVKAATSAKVRSALESAGVIFVEENGEGTGVRLRKGEGGGTVAVLPK